MMILGWSSLFNKMNVKEKELNYIVLRFLIKAKFIANNRIINNRWLWKMHSSTMYSPKAITYEGSDKVEHVYIYLFIYFSSSQYCYRCLMLLSLFQSCFYHKTVHILSALHTHVPGSYFTQKSNMISVEPPVTKFTQNSGVDSIIISLFF